MGCCRENASSSPIHPMRSIPLQQSPPSICCRRSRRLLGSSTTQLSKVSSTQARLAATKSAQTPQTWSTPGREASSSTDLKVPKRRTAGNQHRRSQPTMTTGKKKKSKRKTTLFRRWTMTHRNTLLMLLSKRLKVRANAKKRTKMKKRPTMMKSESFVICVTQQSTKWRWLTLLFPALLMTQTQSTLKICNSNGFCSINVASTHLLIV